MKANILSLTFKIAGAIMIVVAVNLKACGIWDIAITDVIAGAVAMEALVLPIDISKIKETKSEKI